MKLPENAIYIGDGAYAFREEGTGYLVVCTWDGGSILDIVYLDSEVAVNLRDWLIKETA